MISICKRFATKRHRPARSLSPGGGTCLLASLLTLLAPAARAADVTATNQFVRWATQDYLFGDWDGFRTDLSRHGVDIELFYAGSMPDNLAGGLRTGAVYQGAGLGTLDLDSEKLLGYDGGTLHVSGLLLHGEKPFSPNYSGDYNRVNLLDFDNAFRLWELSYRQKFLKDKFSFRFGKLSVDSDFLTPEYYTGFGQFTLLNQTWLYPSMAYNVFSVPGFPANNHGLATTPLATPGAVLDWTPNPEHYLQAGLYGGTPDQTYSGTRFQISQQDGALGYLETGWRRHPGTNDPSPGGTIKLGAYYHTSQFTDAHDGVFYAAGLNPNPAQHTGNYGAYLVAEQQLWLAHGKADPAQRGLVGFARVLGGPPDRGLIDLQFDAGLVARGPLPSRGWDTLALAASYLQFSRGIRHAQQELDELAPGSVVPVDYEGVVELSYKAQLTAWWTLQPSVQHVFHPGGSAALPDATVFILQTTLRF